MAVALDQELDEGHRAHSQRMERSVDLDRGWIDRQDVGYLRDQQLLDLLEAHLAHEGRISNQWEKEEEQIDILEE